MVGAYGLRVRPINSSDPEGPSMTHTALRLSRLVPVFALFAVGVTCIGAVEGGPRRARLSKDLRDRVASGRQAPVDVILSASEAEIQSIAARHGVRIKKVLRGAAVLEATDAQLDALSRDPGVSHLSGDAPVRRTMAVAAESIGAVQVWEGAAALRGYDGKGIGVAVIDSGVARHPSLRGRVV